jgi:hypothetical protein
MVSPPPIVAACDDGSPLQPIAAIAAVIVGIDTDEGEPVPVMMPEERMMRGHPNEVSMAAVMPGFGGPKRRKA